MSPAEVMAKAAYEQVSNLNWHSFKERHPVVAGRMINGQRHAILALASIEPNEYWMLAALDALREDKTVLDTINSCRAYIRFAVDPEATPPPSEWDYIERELGEKLGRVKKTALKLKRTNNVTG